ncbi:protein FAR-RED IMPAIRED RESPONSE [Trifolium repens]|nr:protein FAR-RED IMPAIRED RESPONSE [Trifolium repens]
MDSSNKMVDCGSIHDEVMKVDNINDDVCWEPAAGMCFSCLDEVKSFYGEYALKKGFRWKIRTSRKGPDGEICYLILACSREGSKVSKVSCTSKTLPEKVKSCPAKICVKMEEDGLWYIRKFEADHSHETSPTKARLFKANKKMNLHVKRTIQINDDVGVRINKTFQSPVKDAGEHANIPFCDRDTRNYVYKERCAIGKEGDVKALISYFCQMREQNSNFFYDIDLDVKNVFWADARSRATYEYFGDVVTLDTTYLTNKHDMLFLAFVGVNHHGQSTLLGCGLLSREDTESYVWLFKSWLRCMLGKAPIGIVTDQCKTMQNAIELVFPTTRHRWCLWHIMKKIPEKLSRYDEYKRIKSAMKEAVYDTYTTNDFEEKWCSFIDKFELQHNDWLSGLYNERHKWASTFVRKYFWAGMSTTQRSESVHAFFDGYIDSTTSLNQFVKQYDNALRSRAREEFEADFNSMDTTIPCGSNSSIEKQFQGEYTHAKFKEVQAEFRSKMNCAASLNVLEGCFATYHVLEEVVVGDIPKERVLNVVFNQESHDFNCECSLFEFRGILCCHVLSVCAQERIKNVPEKYVLTRWNKNIKRKHSFIKSSYDGAELEPQMVRFEKLCKHFYDIAEVAAKSEDGTKALHETLHQFNSNLPAMDGTTDKHETYNEMK